MRAIVVGGDGKLGSVLCDRLLARDHRVLRTTRRPGFVGDTPRRREEIIHLDLLDPALLLPNREVTQSDVVYIMAAITGIVPAEQHPDAWRINAEAPIALAMQAKERGLRIVFMSSGTVEKAPHTASARQKSHADLAVLMLGGCVVRPLPFVRPEWFGELADLLVDVGENKTTGVVRWGAER